ncbi:UNVERIFIED_CONTAM: hypothetical protein K2H54_054487, partial [Gekko kuhli]
IQVFGRSRRKGLLSTHHYCEKRKMTQIKEPIQSCIFVFAGVYFKRFNKTCTINGKKIPFQHWSIIKRSEFRTSHFVYNFFSLSSLFCKLDNSE